MFFISLKSDDSTIPTEQYNAYLNGMVSLLQHYMSCSPRKRNRLCQDNIVENVAGAIYMYMVSMAKGVSGSYPTFIQCC